MALMPQFLRDSPLDSVIAITPLDEKMWGVRDYSIDDWVREYYETGQALADWWTQWAEGSKERQKLYDIG